MSRRKIRCTQCGVCCSEFTFNKLYGAPSYFKYIYMLEAILYHLGDQYQIGQKRREFYNNFFFYKPEDARMLYLMLEPKGFDERVQKHVYSCRFLKDKKCSIYDIRPPACRDYGIKYPASHEGCAYKRPLAEYRTPSISRITFPDFRPVNSG